MAPSLVTTVPPLSSLAGIYNVMYFLTSLPPILLTVSDSVMKQKSCWTGLSGYIMNHKSGS